MTWHIPILLRILVGNVLGQIILKKTVGLPSRTRRLLWQSIFAAMLGWLSVLVFDTALPAITTIGTIALLGLVNSGGAYCQWRAMEISQSRTAIFTWADDVIAMGFAYALLSEQKFLTPELTAGVFLCVGSAIALAYVGKQPSEHGSIEHPFAIIGWVASYSIIWGIASFAMRWYGLQSVSVLWFATAWYTGAVVGAMVIRATAGATERGAPISRKGLAGCLLLALVIWLALALKYWASQLAPITVTQPVHQVAELIFPALVGLIVFKEHKELSHSGKALFCVAIAGGLLIAFSY